MIVNWKCLQIIESTVRNLGKFAFSFFSSRNEYLKLLVLNTTMNEFANDRTNIQKKKKNLVQISSNSIQNFIISDIIALNKININ